MKIGCQDLDRILEDGSPQEWSALSAHALACPACREELRAWKELSAAAAGLGELSDPAGLWKRIEQALRQEIDERPGKRSLAARPSAGWPGWGRWRLGLAWALAALLAISLALVFRGTVRQGPGSDPSLLRAATLREVEQAESAYRRAIGKLEEEAQPGLSRSTSLLLANYREKLAVLDSAISELRTETGANPSNAQLRRELLAIYREKQQTLEQILEAEKR